MLALAAGCGLMAQNRAEKAALPPEESFLTSYGIYLGIPVIIGLIVFAIMRRKKEAQVKNEPIVPKDDGIKLTYRKQTPAAKPPKKEGTETPPKPVIEVAPPKEGFAALPVVQFVRLQRTNPYLQLPASRDPGLLQAIEQTNEDSEEDMQVRSKALQLLSSFKTSNSVAAISQMALYDLSSKLRSDAVLILAEMDHESVFETIVTACADPTREVRASAARALFKLTFDRAHAWTRVIESGDMARMRLAARSATEGDLVLRSFDRLVHADKKVAYEAYALTALLVKSGETEPIYQALADRRKETVSLALLHVLQTIRDDRTFDGLNELLTKVDLTPNVAAKVNEVRSMLQMAPAGS